MQIFPIFVYFQWWQRQRLPELYDLCDWRKRAFGAKIFQLFLHSKIQYDVNAAPSKSILWIRGPSCDTWPRAADFSPFSRATIRRNVTKVGQATEMIERKEVDLFTDEDPGGAGIDVSIGQNEVWQRDCESLPRRRGWTNSDRTSATVRRHGVEGVSAHVWATCHWATVQRLTLRKLFSPLQLLLARNSLFCISASAAESWKVTAFDSGCLGSCNFGPKYGDLQTSCEAGLSFATCK